MDKMLKLQTKLYYKALDGSDDLIIEGLANTTGKDRAGDIVTYEAWNTPNALTNYLKNPIVLAYHDHTKPVGSVIAHEVTSRGLYIKAKISKGAGDVYNLIKDEVLQAFSIGFRVLDADYDSMTDLFIIKDVELYEVSVVSVPCNQDSVFSVSKSFKDDNEYAKFKASFAGAESTKDSEEQNSESNNLNNESTDNEEFLMDPKELQEFISKSVSNAISESEQKRLDAEEQSRKAAEDAKAEEARISALVKSNTENLVNDIEAKMKQSSEDASSKIAELQEELKSKSEEITSILASRNNRMEFTDRTGAEVNSKELDEAFILSTITGKDLFSTKLGKEIVEKVNTSSSGQVSSDKYEQEVTTRLYEDIKEMLVVQPLFREIALSSATQVLPINPNSASANWIDPANFGTNASTGAELSKSLTEVILQTYKLAGKSYITDETEEDAIIPILPLLRDQLVEAHAKKIDSSVLNGAAAGASDPINGLINRATTAGGSKVNTTTAKADGSVKATAKMILQTRRGLGQWGLDLNKLSVVVSLDAYWDLLEDDQFSNLDEVGAQATKLTGQVGVIYGMPVMVSTQMPAKALSAPYAMVVHNSNFIVPRLRGMKVDSQYDVEEQRRVIVSTQRLGFSHVINGEGVAVATYAAA